MKYFIPIDRSTFRKNPKAGSTCTVRPAGPTEVYVTVESPHYKAEFCACGGLKGDWPEVEGEFGLCTLSIDNGHDCPFDIKDGVKVRRFRWGTVGDVTTEIRMEQPTETYYHQPDPDYLYGYAPTEVSCEWCKATFPHTELDYDEFGGVWDATYSYTVCPKCRTWNCCELEYEDPEAVAEELGLE